MGDLSMALGSAPGDGQALWTSSRTAVHCKLSAARLLTAGDVRALDRMLTCRETVGAGTMLMSERRPESDGYILLSGWAFRFKVFEDGRRQISRLFLPGDFIGLHAGLLGIPEQPVAALTNVQLAKFDVHAFVERLQQSPRLWMSVLWSDTRDRLIAEERVASIGRRSAYQRLAHMYLELYMRLELVGEAADDRFFLPLTQDHLADLLGLTSIHVNRTMRRLKRDGLIASEGRMLRLLSRSRLAAVADFDPHYLIQQDLRPSLRSASA